MIYVLGFLMLGGYYALLTPVLAFTKQYVPSLTPLALVFFSIAYATLAMKAQTRLERYFIRRHVKKNPNSSWRFVVDKE